MPTFRRKPIRLAPRCYRGLSEYFITICTHNRLKLFWNDRVVNLVLESLRKSAAQFRFGVYAYCFMPDHLHLLVQAQSKDSGLAPFIRAFKGDSTASVRALGERVLWQKTYHDHVLRDSESADAEAWYVFLNPVRAGLVRAMKDWPFSGSFMFDWKRIEDPTAPYVPAWKRQHPNTKTEKLAT